MKEAETSPISIFRLPIYWLFFGPPIFRVLGERAGQASLDGNFDIWNIIRVAWWLFFGLIAVLELYRYRARLPAFVRSLGMFSWWVGMWLFMLFVSALYSPSLILTLASAAMMTILVIASLDLGLKLHSGLIDMRRALKILFGFALALLTLFAFLYFLIPEMVGRRSNLRARGGFIADNALLSQVAFFVGIYLASLSKDLTRRFYQFVVLVSPLFLLAAQTRAMYLSFFLGVTIFLWQWLAVLKSRQRTVMLSLLCLGAGGVMAVALYDEFSPTSGILASVEDFLVRDRASIESFSSRDGVALALIDVTIERPQGLGYAAGTRDFLYNADHVPWAAAMGNAHNMYLEVLAGTGILGGLAWLALLLWLLIRIWRIRGKDAIPIRILYLVVLIGGITESSGVLPFYQPAALLWVMAAFITALPHVVKVSAHEPQSYPSTQVIHAYRHS